MATESFVEKRRKELRGMNGGQDSASSFVERRKKELRGEIQTPEQQKQSQVTSQVLKDTLAGVTKPSQAPAEQPYAIDFKAAQQKQEPSVFQDKLPAASAIQTGQGIQSTLKGMLPAADLVQQTGRGPANASSIPGISEYGIREKAIDETNIPEVLKLPSRAMNYAAYGNPLGVAASRAFAGNSGASRRDSTDFPLLDKATDAVNDLVTPFLTPTGAPVGQGIIGSTYDATGKALSGKAGQAVLKGAEKIIPGSPNVVRVATTEALAGGLQGAGFGLQQGQDSGREIARNALLGTAAGGVIGGVGAAAGEAFPKLLNMFRKSGIADDEIAEIAPELLSLPEANPRTVRKQLAGEIKTSSSTDPITTPYTPQLNAATPETQAAFANRQAAKSFDPAELNTKYAQDVIDEYKRLKDSNSKRISNKNLYDQARQTIDQQRPSDANFATQKMKDTRVNGQSYYDGDPIIRNPQLTREQEIMNKFERKEPLTQADIEFSMSSNWDDNKLFPESTPTESTYVKPRSVEVTQLKTEPTQSINKTPVVAKEPTKTTITKERIPGERGFAQTLRESDKTPEGFTSKLDTTYEPTTNRGDLAKAEERIKDRAGATRYILEDTKGGMTSEQSITAQRLIDTHLKEGNTKAAEEVADALLRESTRSAQFLQSLSAYNKLSPEGVFLVAKRMANKVNETSSKLARKAEVTPQMADDLKGLAAINQKMTGVKDLSNDAVDILNRAKSGEKLSAADASTLKKFVDESRQFIKETSKNPSAPKEPKLPKEKRVRDSVSSFLDAQEAAAKERLRAKGVRISSTPLDIWADYAVIGAAKMGRNIIKFADWSEQMVKDLGEDIRPHLGNLYEKSKEMFDLSSKKISSKTVSAAERLTQKVINSKELSTEEADSLLKLVSQVDNLSGEAKITASQDLQAILQSLDKPTIGKKISSLQTQAQLLNPKTQVRNVLGNELFYRLERIEKYLSTPIDIARSKVTGTDRKVTFRTHNQGKFWENFISGGRAGWKGVNINGIETQYDLASPAFTGKYNPFRYTEKALGASLRSFDNAAYSRGMNKSLGELGTLDAINNGVKPTKEYVQNFIRNADENVMKIAQDYGKYVTFQDNNLLSQGFTKFKRGLNFGKDFGVGDLVLKYPKTPAALLMRALEYSPAGFLRSAKIAAEPLLRNGVEKNPAEAVQALSRAIIGTGGLSMFGYYLMDKGVITGSANPDKDIRSLETKTGKGAYQVNLSALYRFAKSGFDDKETETREGDQMYNYDWLQPVSVAISLGANVQKSQGKENKIASGLVGSAFSSTAGALDTLGEQSLLKGVEQALSGYTGETMTDKLVSIIADMPASFVPTASNQLKQTGDNAKRETYAPNIIDQSLNKVKAKIPGLAETLPKKYDTLGDEQTHYQDSNAFNIYANPGFPTKYKLTPEAKIIVDLIKATGDETLAPRVPGKSVNGMKLSGEEFSRYSQLQGEETKSLLADLDTTMSTEDQAEEVARILREAGANAKEKLLEEYPRLVKSDD